MRRPYVIVIGVTLLVGLVACNLPYGVASPTPVGPTVTSNPDASPTATAFIPVPPTETPAATPTPSATPTPMYPWADFPGPVQTSAIEIPTPASPIQFASSIVNVVLLGSDQRPYQGFHLTDTIMIISLNPATDTVTLLSIPRDLYVYVPGWRVDRINTADIRGGPEMVKQTILYNFGIRIDLWARVDFPGFVAAIDTLGGIDVQVTGYLTDSCAGKVYSYRSGTTVHMDGWTALCYVRMRQTTGDFDRLRRQQEVIQAVFRKVISLDGLSRVPQLYSQFGSMVQTDMGLGDVLPMIPLAASLSTGAAELRRYAIDSSMSTQWRVPSSGASVLLPNREAIQIMLQSAFGS